MCVRSWRMSLMGSTFVSLRTSMFTLKTTIQTTSLKLRCGRQTDRFLPESLPIRCTISLIQSMGQLLSLTSNKVGRRRSLRGLLLEWQLVAFLQPHLQV